MSPPSLPDRFQILDRLGEGGMGAVFKAYDKLRQSQVALKVLRNATPEAIYRFKLEFRALADVRHPNLVTLYELHQLGDEWMFTMELIDGVDLTTWLRGDAARVPSRLPSPDDVTADRGAGVAVPPLPALAPADLARLTGVLAQLTDGIDALHRAHILHRDLKPSNVLVDASGRVVILDFGVLVHRGADERDPTTRIIGTPAYMSPEQLAGAPLTPPSDWYAVGLMLYEALTGRRPFSGNPTDIRHRKDHGDYPRPRELNPAAPEPLDRLCVALLDPSPVRRATAAEVRAALDLEAVPRATDAPAGGPFARAHELGELRGMVRALDERSTGLVLLVHGSSGVGKTAVVEALLGEIAPQPRTVVLTGRCYQQESVPFKSIDSLMDSLASWMIRLPKDEVSELLPAERQALCHLFPVLRRVPALGEGGAGRVAFADPKEARRRGFDALRELFERLARRHRLVLFIDDLQWGDIDSTALLLHVLREPTPRLLLIGTYRSEEAETSEPLAALLHHRATLPTRSLALAPLTAERAAALAGSLLGEAGREAAALIARESGGNPFFITELVRFTLDGAGQPASGAPRASRLDDMIAARTERLPAEARRMLELAVLAGRPTSATVLARAGGISSSADVIQLLRAHHFVRLRTLAGDEQIEAYHDRIRECLVARIEPGLARRYHAALASSLAALPEPEHEPLARHYEAAGDPDAASQHYAEAGAQAALGLAFDHAVDLLQKAIALRSSGSAVLQARLGDALSNAGRGREAAVAYLAAAEAEPTEAGAAPGTSDLASRHHRRAAEELLRAGHLELGVSELRRAAEHVGLSMPTRPLASLLWLRARARLRGLDASPRREPASAAELERLDLAWSASSSLAMTYHILGAVFQTRHLLLALKSGDPAHLSKAYGIEAVFRAVDPSARRAAESLCERARVAAERAGDPASRGIALGATGIVRYHLGDWEGSLDRCTRAAALLRAEANGVWWEINTCELHTLWALSYLGRFAELTRRARDLQREIQARGDLYMTTCLTTDLPALAWLVRDDPEGGLQASGDSMRDWQHSAGGYHVQHWSAALAEANALVYMGRGPEAWDRMCREWPPLRRSLLLTMQLVRIEAYSVWARAALAAAEAGVDRERALAVARRSTRLLAKQQPVHAHGFAALQSAGLHLLDGERERARADLERAAACFDEAQMVVHAAIARRRLGPMLGGDEGARLSREAAALLAREGIVDHERFTNLFAPATGG